MKYESLDVAALFLSEEKTYSPNSLMKFRFKSDMSKHCNLFKGSFPVVVLGIPIYMKGAKTNFDMFGQDWTFCFPRSHQGSAISTLLFDPNNQRLILSLVVISLSSITSQTVTCSFYGNKYELLN